MLHYLEYKESLIGYLAAVLSILAKLCLPPFHLLYSYQHPHLTTAGQTLFFGFLQLSSLNTATKYTNMEEIK